MGKGQGEWGMGTTGGGKWKVEVMKFAGQEVQSIDESVNDGCVLGFVWIQLRHWRACGQFVLLAEEHVNFCPMVRPAPPASLGAAFPSYGRWGSLSL